MTAITANTFQYENAESQAAEAAAAKKKKLSFSAIFNKLADVGARGAVTSAIKFAAVSTLVGAGASSFVTIGVAAAAAGAGSALYAYSKDLIQDVMLARKDGHKVSLWNAERSKKVKIALLSGVAGGAFGAWFAGTDTFKAGLDLFKDYGLKAVSGIFNAIIPSAEAAEPILSTVAPIAAAVAPVAVAMSPIADVAAPLAVVAPVSVPVADAPKPNVVGKLWGMMMSSDQAQGKMMAEMLNADPTNAKSVSAQFLKDRAHDILRVKDIPAPERFAMAKELAEEAQARGNKQAGQFLKDLAKMARIQGISLDTVIATPAAPVAAVVAPVAEIAAPVAAAPVSEVVAPIVAASPAVVADVVPAAAPVVAAPVAVAPPAAADIAAIVTPVAPVAATTTASLEAFREAGRCIVAGPDIEGAYDVTCDKLKAFIQPGDHLSFVSASNPLAKGIVPYTIDSSFAIETEKLMVSSQVQNDGVKKVIAATAALAPKALASR